MDVAFIDEDGDPIVGILRGDHFEYIIDGVSTLLEPGDACAYVPVAVLRGAGRNAQRIAGVGVGDESGAIVVKVDGRFFVERGRR